jgi:uncharacterized protein YqgC (DUF456 family)
MNNKLKPAIIGGVVAGLLSAIPLLHICCCLWAVLGGILASYLYIKASPNPVKAGEGAVLGVLAGVVGGVICIVIGIPLAILLGPVLVSVVSKLVENVDPRQVEQLRQQMLSGGTVAGAILGGLFRAFLVVLFSTLGGLLGVPIFEKRKGDPTSPPPTQGIGGNQPGSGFDSVA